MEEREAMNLKLKGLGLKGSTRVMNRGSDVVEDVFKVGAVAKNFSGITFQSGFKF